MKRPDENQRAENLIRRDFCTTAGQAEATFAGLSHAGAQESPAANILNSGRRIAILAGQGALGARPEVQSIAETLGAFVTKALPGKAVPAGGLAPGLPFALPAQFAHSKSPDHGSRRRPALACDLALDFAGFAKARGGGGSRGAASTL